MEKIITTLISLVIVGMIFFGIFNGYMNNQHFKITVSDKYIKRSGEQDIYLVVDQNKNTYKITDLFLKFKFNSTDLYNELEIGQTYEVMTSGYRIKILSEYPNINKIKKVEN